MAWYGVDSILVQLRRRDRVSGIDGIRKHVRLSDKVSVTHTVR